MQQLKRLPTYFISHGGGPWPWLKSEMPFYDNLENSLKDIPKQIDYQKPKAILVISAHWEESEFTVMASPNPPMVYDYYGFPESTYHIKYPAPGSPELARQIQQLGQKNGINILLDNQRGFDHGVFVPLYVMYPKADIPILQLSINKNYHPETHFCLGQALAPLRDENVLIIGSGLSYHNLRDFGRTEVSKNGSKEFDDWLQKTLVHSSKDERYRQLLNWSQAPSARVSHPREDHLVPLMVIAGTAENEKADLTYHENNFFGALSVSSFRFGNIE